jgi:hypothetical protein
LVLQITSKRKQWNRKEKQRNKQTWTSAYTLVLQITSKRKQWNRKEKQRNKQTWTSTYTLVLQIMSKRKQWKRKEKQRNKQTWTSTYTLVLQIMSFFLSSFFWVGPIDFPFKMIPCKLNHNLICFGLGFLFKSLETNLKLLTNRNAQFQFPYSLNPCLKWPLN